MSLDRRIEFVQGDITHQDVDAIVNAANSGLRGGGGVDGAIHRAGGPEIMAECRKLKPPLGFSPADAGATICPTGDARITTGGRLRARYVIHAVGPVYRDGSHGEAELLASAYRRSLEVASAHGVRRLAFPSISTGVYAFPIAQAARIALGTVQQYLAGDAGLTLVRFVLFSAADLRVYEDAGGII